MTKPTIDLRGPDGNAFVVLGRTQRLMRLRGDGQEQIKQVMDNAVSGSYDHLLDVCAQAVGWRYIGRPKRTAR